MISVSPPPDDSLGSPSIVSPTVIGSGNFEFFSENKAVGSARFIFFKDPIQKPFFFSEVHQILLL